MTDKKNKYNLRNTWIIKNLFFSTLLLLPQPHLAIATTLLTQVGIFVIIPSLKVISPMITKLLYFLNHFLLLLQLFLTQVEIFVITPSQQLTLFFFFFCKLTIDIVDITNNNKTSLQKAILISDTVRFCFHHSFSQARVRRRSKVLVSFVFENFQTDVLLELSFFLFGLIYY